MKILGIDPSIRRTGWAMISVLDDIYSPIASGVIETKDTFSLNDRVFTIYKEMMDICWWKGPNAVAMEGGFVGRNVATAMKLVSARTACMLACGDHDLSITEYKPTTWRSSLGDPQYDKEEVRTMVEVVLGKLDIRYDDESDAYGVAICHAGTLKEADIVSRSSS